ncbi:hypothetical protein ACFWUZ_01020 [Streptomyces sp. NPDC058646]|uniref:hypothetical protein n=1 Tax=Streptomyces sp. NPDC058646 TaxID=3346574 RepID=UPI00365AAE87
MAESERGERPVRTAAHPVAHRLLSDVLARGPVVRVPRAGVVVGGARPTPEVLTDPERWTRTGPGAAGGVWTAVPGPGVPIPGYESLSVRAVLPAS